MTEINGGWRKRVLMWDWHDLVLGGWPGWERGPGGDEPPRVDIAIVKGEGKSSHLMASEFDDVASGPFYWRDYTASGLPFADDGEVYRSAFWLARREDREAFRDAYCAKRLSTPGGFVAKPRDDAKPLMLNPT